MPENQGQGQIQVDLTEAVNSEPVSFLIQFFANDNTVHRMYCVGPEISIPIPQVSSFGFLRGWGFPHIGVPSTLEALLDSNSERAHTRAKGITSKAKRSQL